MLIRIPKGWEIPEREATPETAYYNRRQILAAAGFSLLGESLHAANGPYPAKHNDEFKVDIAITPEFAATGYNNYYEFHPTDKEAVKNNVGAFVTSPWAVDVGGLCNKPGKFEVEDLVKKFPLEERVYRFRCVERWAMVVPWTGFLLSDWIKALDPKAEAKYVAFTTVNRPKEMPGIKMAPWYPWPYTEGLRMDEAMNPLTMVVTGLYGKPLPRQNGAPIRIITPWKYGYKSIKSIVKMEFTKSQPPTLWNKVQPEEYGFYSNINPKQPHPRWSQAVEQLIPTMERRPTLLYNGYEKYVAGMYNGKEH